jgi:hypothetical protein
MARRALEVSIANKKKSPRVHVRLTASIDGHRSCDATMASPDGKWLADCSSESSEYRIYVVPFPGPGGKWQVSSGDGQGSFWRRDGKEILYLSADNKLMAVKVETSGGSFAAGETHALFDSHSYGVFGRYDVSTDGQRFVVVYEGSQSSGTLTFVVNWPAELKTK